MRLFLIGIIFSISTWAYDLSEFRTGCADQARVTGQALLVEKDSKIYAVTSDLSAVNESCPSLFYRGEAVDLKLIHINARAGLALFETKLMAIQSIYSDAQLTPIARRLKIIRAVQDEKNEIAAKTLQTNSNRSFFPIGTSTIEIQADGILSKDQGALVVNDKSQLIGVISRYQLIFKVGYVTWVEKVSSQVDAPIPAPVIYPLKYILKWIDQSLSDKSPQETFRVISYDRFKMSVQVGNLLFSEDCTFARVAAQNLSPIGGFDGYGIGGFDGYGIGGLDVKAIGGYGEPATACDQFIEVLPLKVQSSVLYQDVEKKYAPGKKLRILGHERLNPETNEDNLIAVISLDHFFKHQEIPGTRALYAWDDSKDRVRSLEREAADWSSDMRREFNRDRAANANYDPAYVYYANIVRLTTLTMMSTEPELTNLKQWNKFFALATEGFARAGYYSPQSSAIATHETTRNEFHKRINDILSQVPQEPK